MNWRENVFIICLFSLFLSISTLIFAASYRMLYPVCPCSSCSCEVAK